MNEQDFLSKMNEILGATMGRPARFRGYAKGPIWYCWNTEPFNAEPKPWATWKYRRNKAKGTWKKIGKQLYFTSRKKAKVRAYKWYQKALVKENKRE